MCEHLCALNVFYFYLISRIHKNFDIYVFKFILKNGHFLSGEKKN